MATSNPTQVTQYQTGFAPELAPYAQQLLGAAAGQIYDYARDAQGNVIYDATGMPQIAGMRAPATYPGERVAQFTDLQKQAFQAAGQLGPSTQTTQAARDAARYAAQAAGLRYTPARFQNQFRAPRQYQPSTFNYRDVSAPALTQYQMQAPSERVTSQSFVQPGTAESYMSPYIQSVIDKQTREAQRQADIASTSRGAKYAQAGAFGGARQAIENAEAQRNLAMQMGDIQATGLQSAYQQAQQQFNQEQAARQAAQQANLGSALTVGQQNLAAQLGIQQLGAGQGLQSQLANQQAALQAQQQQELARQFGYGQQMQSAQLGAQYGQAAQQLQEQANQFGAGLGLQGLQAGMTGAQTAGNLGNLGFGQQQAAIGLQSQLGGQQQAQTQNILSQQYQDFLNQQNMPFKQLGFMSDVLRGSPVSQTGAAMYSQPPSMLSQIGGLGATAIGAFGASGGFGRKAGGHIKEKRPAGLSALALAKLAR